MKEIRGILKKNPPYKENTIHGKMNNVKYYSKDEMDLIIKAFYEKYGDTNRPHLIETGFRTGLRTEELFPLTWGDLYYTNEKAEKIMWISVNKAYCSQNKIVKCTKTNETRDFKLSKKTQELFERIKPNNVRDIDLVFLSPQKKYLNSASLIVIWYGEFDRTGEEKYFRPGVVSKLFQEGKLSKYLPPYQMRATFINHQLLKGVNSYVLSEITGHDIDTMKNNYISFDGSEVRIND
jgi:integrase